MTKKSSFMVDLFLKEAIKAFQNQEIKNWYIRKVFSVSFFEGRRMIQIYSQI